MNFLSELHKSGNKTARTANGAVSNKSTLDPLLDFFSNAGAMRGKEAEATKLFKAAFAVDPTNAMRCLFYLRDIRGGQGERSVFRAILDTLDKDTIAKVVRFIPEYGRWDEVPFTLEGVSLIKKQLAEDTANMRSGKGISLLAKWLPSENTSSLATKSKAKKLATALDMKSSHYRKTIVALRKHIKLLEQQMSAREWSEVQYEKLPSQAHRKHIAAFKRHDETRYDEFIGAVNRGEKTVNADTLFTYEVFDAVAAGRDAEANAMWKSLPDFTKGQNALVLPDVSGSMYGRPLSISVSLALYFAERNEGLFKDYFLAFSSESELVKVRGNTLTEKLASIQHSTGWMGSTNLQSAFDAILNAAKASNASPEEMPEMLYIISDMQFNVATNNNSETNFEVAQRKFKEAGYEMPHVVFWNVNARGDEAPATMYDNKVTLISGSNQSTFQHVVAGKTPIDSMLDILQGERYSQIVV
jgi:uncharacterized protein DUF2828